MPNRSVYAAIYVVWNPVAATAAEQYASNTGNET